jgi:hypothetical protein
MCIRVLAVLFRLEDLVGGDSPVALDKVVVDAVEASLEVDNVAEGGGQKRVLEPGLVPCRLEDPREGEDHEVACPLDCANLMVANLVVQLRKGVAQKGQALEHRYYNGQLPLGCMVRRLHSSHYKLPFRPTVYPKRVKWLESLLTYRACWRERENTQHTTTKY